MDAANDSAAASPTPPSAVAGPASGVSGAGPRDQSAHAAAATSRHASPTAASLVRRSELIGQAHAEEVVGDLVDLLQVDEVEDTRLNAPVAGHNSEVVARAVGAGEARVVEDDPPAVVERAQPLAVLQVEPVAGVVAGLKVAGEVVVVL